MTTVNSQHRLAIVSGPAVVLWDCFAEQQQTGQVENGDDELDVVTTYPHGTEYNISCVAWNHNAMILASSTTLADEGRPDNHDSVDLMATMSGQTYDTFQHDDNNRSAGRINSLSFAAGSRFLCLGDEKGQVTIFDLKKKKRVRQWSHPTHTPSIQVGMDSKNNIILSMSDECIYCYGLRTGKLLGTLLPRSSSTRFTRFHISPIDTNVVAVGTLGGDVIFFDLSEFDNTSRRKQQQKQHPSSSSAVTLEAYGALPQKHEAPVTGLSFSRVDPNILLSSGGDGNAFVWDIKLGKEIEHVCSLETENDVIRSMSLHDDGAVLAIGTEAGQVQLFEIATSPDQTSRLVGRLEFDGPIEEVAFAPLQRDKGQLSSTTTKTTTTMTSQQENSQGLGNMNDNTEKKASLVPFDLTSPTPAKFKLPPEDRSDNHNTKDSDEEDFTIIKALSTESSVIPPAYSGPSSPESDPETVQQQQHPTMPSASNASSSPPMRGPHEDKSLESTEKPFPPNGPSQLENKSALGAATALNTAGQQVAQPQHQQPMIQPAITASEVREIVQNEVESLGDSMEEKLRNLHLVLISNFHQQSEELKMILSDQMAAISSLTEENRILREENEQLRRNG